MYVFLKVVVIMASLLVIAGCASGDRRDPAARTEPPASAPAREADTSEQAGTVMMGTDADRAMALLDSEPPPPTDRREPAAPPRRSPVNQPRGGRP